jgi:hypothetical protein
MAKKQRGYMVSHSNGFLCATYRAFNRADVVRALDLEWGDEAKGMAISAVPLHTCYDNELSTDHYHDLTSNAGWASIISRQEVEAMA